MELNELQEEITIFWWDSRLLGSHYTACSSISLLSKAQVNLPLCCEQLHKLRSIHQSGDVPSLRQLLLVIILLRHPFGEIEVSISLSVGLCLWRSRGALKRTAGKKAELDNKCPQNSNKWINKTMTQSKSISGDSTDPLEGGCFIYLFKLEGLPHFIKCLMFCSIWCPKASPRAANDDM